MERIPPTGDPAESPPVPGDGRDPIRVDEWDDDPIDPALSEEPGTTALDTSDDDWPTELSAEFEPDPEPEPEIEAAPDPPQILASGPVTIGVPRETEVNERRVGLVPDVVKRLTGQGVEVIVEAGAGQSAHFLDEAYANAGATVADRATVYAQANLIVKVQKPTPDEVALLRPGQALIAFMQPMVNTDLVRSLQRARIAAFSMDAIPRTSRAQYMDALSSMATVAGYKAVLMAADHLAKFMPLLTTAAGNIPPAKVLVIGAGVAGLQAIATARRLGAVVEAYDTRPVVKEQVQSLGARFIEIETGATDTQTAAGYAREATAEELAAQQAELARRSARSDIIITTAAVPGRAAPRLISAETVNQMAPGSVIVDLAAEMGGNCAYTSPGETVVRNGVTVIGETNLASTMPVHASQMYSRNVLSFLTELLVDGELALDFEDEIVRETCVTHEGRALKEPVRV
jgi:H+-translocating NAD(P) transhydrogenase subunit alpha